MALSAEEEETLDSIKRWWRESGRQIALGIGLVAVVYFGWQFFQNSQTRAAADASAIYDRLQGLAVTAPGQLVPESSRSDAMDLIQTLKSDHSATVYALYAALFEARIAVEQGDLAAARDALQWLLANTRSGLFGSTDPTLVQLAHLRLAQVLLDLGETDQALTQISAVDSQSLQPQFDELRGDIYLAQGQLDLAAAAYESAAASGNVNPVLQMKLSELRSSP